MKECTKCRETKVINEFYLDKKKKDGLFSACKSCIKRSNKAYKALEVSPETRKAYNKKYYSNNSEKIIKKVQDRLLVKDNKENKIAYDKEYSSKNRDRYNECQRKYAKTDSGKASQSVRRTLRRERIIITDDSTITKDALVELFIEQNNKCFHCGIVLDKETPRAIHLDHIIPLSKGGQHTLSNVKWSCADCNMKKGCKLTL